MAGTPEFESADGTTPARSQTGVGSSGPSGVRWPDTVPAQLPHGRGAGPWAWRWGVCGCERFSASATGSSMRPILILIITLPFVAPTLGTPSISAAPSTSNEYHIVLPRRAIGAGERVTLRLAPPAPPGVRVYWLAYEGSSGTALQPHAVYRAPYLIPVGTPPARVTAALTGHGVKTSVTTEIELMPGSVPGAEDCLGPGQSFSTTIGAVNLGPSPISDVPVLIRSVVPDYPRSALARGVEDTITVIALVCRTGRVLDAYAPTPYLDLEMTQPMERDPKLVEAAVEAVRRYEFSPATAAVLVVTAVQFRH